MDRKPRDDGRSRLARAKGYKPSRPWGMLVAANSLPILVALVVGGLWWKGTIKFVPGSKTVIPSLVVLGVALVVLVVIAWIIAPALLPMVKRTREFVDRNLTLLFKGNLIGAPLRLILVVSGIAAYGVLWANLLVLALLALVDIAAILTSLVVFVREVWKAKG